MDTTQGPEHATSDATGLAALAARPGVRVEQWHTELIDTQYGDPRAIRYTITVWEPGRADVHGTTTTHYLDWHDPDRFKNGGDS